MLDAIQEHFFLAGPDPVQHIFPDITSFGQPRSRCAAKAMLCETLGDLGKETLSFFIRIQT